MFSIITVVLNDPSGLQETATSIMRQTSINFDWIIVDGGSNDGTLDCVRNIEKLDPIIHTSKDKGIYDAMNKGIDLSTGQYLIYMNAGDTFSDAAVLSDAELFIQNNSDIDVVLGGTYQKIRKCVFYRPPKNISWIVSGLPAFHQSTIYRAALMQDRKYNLKYPLLADYEWLAYACVSGVNIGYLNRPLSVFSVGGASYTNIKQKFSDSYAVKFRVLGFSKYRSYTSSLFAILKTVFVMFVLYRVCAVFNRNLKIRSVKKSVNEAGVHSVEYYKHDVT